MEQTFSTLASVVQTQYELHLHEMQRSAVGGAAPKPGFYAAKREIMS